MAEVHVDCNNKEDLKREVNVKDYYRIVKVQRGYWCFNNAREFDRWMESPPDKYKVMKF